MCHGHGRYPSTPWRNFPRVPAEARRAVHPGVADHVVLLRRRWLMPTFWAVNVVVTSSEIQPSVLESLLRKTGDRSRWLGSSRLAWTNVFGGWLFLRSGWLPPIVFRLAFYLVWHVIFGGLRSFLSHVNDGSDGALPSAPRLIPKRYRDKHVLATFSIPGSSASSRILITASARNGPGTLADNPASREPPAAIERHPYGRGFFCGAASSTTLNPTPAAPPAIMPSFHLLRRCESRSVSDVEPRRLTSSARRARSRPSTALHSRDMSRCAFLSSTRAQNIRFTRLRVEAEGRRCVVRAARSPGIRACDAVLTAKVPRSLALAPQGVGAR